MQQDSNKKKGKGYRVRPAFARERLNGRTRRVCSILGLAAVVLASAVVVHSLYVIQIRDGAKYRQYAAQQQLLDTTVKATRGEIYDANGITLASTSVVWNIWADPSYSSILYTTSTNDDKTTVRTFDPTMCAEVSQGITLRLLSGDGESLDAVDTSSEEYTQQYQTVYDALSKIDSSYVVLATKVNNAVKLSIEDYVSGFNKAHKKGSGASRIGRVSVSTEKSSQRNYPYGAFAAAVLGFTDGEGVGTYGLEKSYQSTLAGVDGRTITRRNAVGNAIADQNATTFAAKDGSNLVLSLDVNVQEIVERYLTEAVAANNVENRGCAIVMNVKTGAILAMASKPDFDPNTPLDYSANLAYLQEQVAAEPELYTIYLRDENDSKKFKLDENGNKIVDPDPDYTGTYRDILWKNKAITELYYPGSVFKVITSAMGLDSGVATMNTTFTCAGAYGVAKETYHCAGHKAHGTINMADALRQSCNIYYIQLGQRVGSQQFYNYFDAFGFTERTGVDLPSETGLMKYYSANQLGEVQLASSAFGQAMAITPLQMCTAVAAAVNGGYLVTPMWWIRSPTPTATWWRRSEANSKIALLEAQISQLETENRNLLTQIANASVEEAPALRQQHNVNKTKIDNLKKELATWQQQLADIQNAKSEAANDNATSTDDYYRIPAIMQDVKSAYNLTWQGAGSWNGYTYVRTATMPNINGIITFKATLSIARKPKYFLGIKIHRAILQISWELTSEYTDTQVVDVLTLDPNASDEEKTRQVNSRISEIAQEFPSCSITTEYAKSEATQTADNDDVIHLLWSSDRLEIAREVDSRITKIYADLVSLEKMMHYKRSIIDVLKDILPSIDADQGRRRTLIEECYERWRENADPNRGNGEDNENEN